ncbi:HEAT repeat-containing protein 6 [Mactra antiquata]
MAVQANFSCPDREKFQYCYSRLLSFKYSSEESVKTDINLLLDQLNSLEYSSVIVTSLTGCNLLNKLCNTIPLHDDRLVVKYCQLTNTWMRKQMLQLDDQCLKTTTNYLIKAVERCQKWTTPEILAALASVVYENVDRLEEFHQSLLGKQGILLQLINNEVTDSHTLEEAVLCVECLTLKPSTGSGYLSTELVDVCFDLFCMLLHKIPSTTVEQLLQCKIIVNSLRGIQNLIQVTKIVPHGKLGVLLAALRAYMFYGLYSQPLRINDCLYPSPFIKVDIPTLGKLSDTSQKKSTDSHDDTGKKKAKRKVKKKAGGKQNSPHDRSHGDDLDNTERSTGASNTFGTSMEADLSSYTTWSKISSSESEWSDTEGGQSSKLRSFCTKVRQCALACFYWLAKMTDKKLMFSYWSCFIPDSQNSDNAQTFFTIIQKDPSPKCRMGALAALSVLIDGTKLLLAAAEDSDEKKTVAFTPFSVMLGSTIKEIHRCLLQAMVCEDYPITLTQLIKCFGIVIANVPYHRMRPGLLSRIIKNVKHFIYHRDPNVRVACLTCLGAMAAIQPPLMEVCHIIQPSRPPVTSKQPTPVDSDTIGTDNQAPRYTDQGLNIPSQASKDTDSGFNSSPGIQSPGGALQFGGGGVYGESGGNTTPKLGTAGSSGFQTPVYTDQLLQSHASDISWVVKLCVKNILPQQNPSEFVFGGEESYTEPIPVRLESLQVLANLTKGYFPIIRNCVPLLQDLIHKCFCDTDSVIKLHTAKLLDEFSQVMLQDVSNTDTEKQNTLDHNQVLEFWLSLLNGPIQDILQNTNNDGNAAVKSSTCDCLANIGDAVFKLLPLDKRIMCLTVVLGLANDDDRFIRASAIRTLGVYVLYSCVREDVSFVADATSAILGVMEDKNIAVRVKAAWSLANLGDALALNREENDVEFLTDFSDVLALNVVTVATRACQDSDKVKPNGVRALGNILRFISAKQLYKEAFNQAVSAGVAALVKCVSSGAMKVRWNACYAISNMYKNTDLKQETASWNVDILRVLCTVVKDCKNFKVRINAAMALSSPQYRELYGDTITYCNVWSGVVDAFNTAEEIDEFVNFKYRDNLVEQLCVASLHLISVLELRDITELLPLLQNKGELLSYSLEKYYSVRQKISQMDKKLESAMTRLESIKSQRSSDDVLTCTGILHDICTQLSSVADIDPFAPKPKSTFVESYD